MGQLTVRFVGAFLLHLDDTNFGRVYLRANPAGSTTPQHVPRITYPMDKAVAPDETIPVFRDTDRLFFGLNGHRLVHREIPPNQQFKFTVDGEETEFSRGEREPTSKIDDDLRIDFLPPLTSGGATKIRPHAELLALSTAYFELGNRGHFSTERVVRNVEGDPIRWTFRRQQPEPNDPAPQHIIADGFCWTIDFVSEILISSDNEVLVALLATDAPLVEIVISNFEERPMRNDGNRLNEFAALLDYGTGVTASRVPEKDHAVTSGSVTCPAARHP